MKYEISELNEKNLRKLYSEYGIRLRELGDLFGLSADALLKRIKSFGIPTLPRSKKRSDVEIVFTGIKKNLKKALTDDLLMQYCNEGKTDLEIGRMYDMTGEGVAYRRKRAGIKITDKFRLVDEKRNNFLNTDKEQLKDDYYSLSQESFSDKYGLSTTIWRPILKDLGFIPKFEERELRYPPLTKEQRVLIIGSLLGDGGISKESSFYEFHCSKQYQYLQKKHDILLPYAKRIKPDRDGFNFRTVSHSCFKEFREHFYEEDLSGKLIPLSLISKEWDDRILAYWFFDDGYYDDVTHSFSIYNKCPKQVQIQDMVSFLESKYHWNFRIDGNYNITFSKMYYENFCSILMGIATPDMFYKIPEQFLSREVISNIKVTSVESIQPKFYRLANDNSKAIMENILFEHYQKKGFPYVDLTEDRLVYLANSFNNRQNFLVPEDDIIPHTTSGIKLCEAFFPNIYRSNRKGYDSPVDSWDDDVFLRKLVKNRLKHADRINDNTMRKGLKLVGGAVSNFRPSVAKYVFEEYCNNGKILDYSGGFGSRLLAAMSLGMEYFGCEPCGETFSNLINFGGFLTKRGLTGTFDVIKEGSESAIFKKNYYGLAFSSPPYFDYESYSKEDSQSIVKYPSYDLWLDKFWDKVIHNCYEALEPNGIFGVCLSPQSCNKIIDRTFSTCSNVGLYFLKDLKVPFPHVLGGGEKHEVILLFSKSRVEEPEPRYIKENLSVKEFKKVYHFPVNYNWDEAKSKFKEISSRHGISRETYRDGALLGLPSHVLERKYGSWNNFVRECDLEPQYEAHTPVEHTGEYLSSCIEAKKVLSFYQFEKITGKPASRLKRLFNAGRPFHHLRDELMSVALVPGSWPQFLQKIKV